MYPTAAVAFRILIISPRQTGSAISAALGSTKYVFCGHDHRNTFSLVYKGVWLGYGMSIDYSANGIVPPPFAYNQDIYDETEQRGGTLITLDAESGVSVSQVPFTRNLYQEAVEQRGNGTK